MKPKNKFQKQVVEASKKLPKLTDTQIKWGYDNCIEYIGRRTTKGKITCTKCGHSWQGVGYLSDTIADCSCPHCNTHLKVTTTQKRTFLDYEYLCIVTACEGNQVLRFIYLECNMKVGEKAKHYYSEVIQRWIAPNGKYATMARLRPMGFFCHAWNWYTDLEIRPDKSLYNITPTKIYPRQKLIPEIQRSGFNKQFYDLKPFDFFRFLLSDSRAETLLKANQIDLFKYFAITSKNIAVYWQSIKICMRNGYKFKDVGMWADYIDSLRFFEKDLHNAKYICPNNLEVEHDRYVKKKRAYYEKIRKEEDKRTALENEAIFKELKSKFFGIEFTDGLIQIRVLESVEEIMQEGDAMHHCVFTNNYYSKPDSLILSACMDGQRLETIEVSLSRLEVLQSRGICNKNTKYHKQILNLVNQNIPLIQRRMTA